MCQGLGQKKHDDISEIDRTPRRPARGLVADPLQRCPCGADFLLCKLYKFIMSITLIIINNRTISEIDRTESKDWSDVDLAWGLPRWNYSLMLVEASGYE